MKFVDTHCHLHFDSFETSRAQVLADSIKSGVDKIICVGTTLEDSRQAIKYAQAVEGVYAAAGVHPHEAAEFLKDKNAHEELSNLLKSPKIVAIGEIGLDFYKDYAPRLDQEKALRRQIEAAISSGLPFIFHVRDAWSDFWRIFDEYKNLLGVVHSFSSGIKQLNAALERGLYIGLNGIMTFTKDEAQLEAARQVPLDKMLLETDAPFLAPLAYRGQICEPKHVVATAEFLAKLRRQTIKEISEATTDNAEKLFSIK